LHALLCAAAGGSRRAVSHDALASSVASAGAAGSGDGWSLPVLPFIAHTVMRDKRGPSVPTAPTAPMPWPAPPQHLGFQQAQATLAQPERAGGRRGLLGKWKRLFAKPEAPLVEPQEGVNLVAKELLGIGRRGKVWKASLTTPDGGAKDVAVKVERVSLSRSSNSPAKAQAMREAAIMEHFSGGHFLEYYGTLESGDCFLHLSELADSTLQNLVLDQPFEVVKVDRRVSLATDLMDGLREMAKEGVVHRSIQPQNLMVVDSEPRQILKIGDLSHACSMPVGPEALRLCSEEEREQAGNFDYPTKEISTPKGDVYAAGLVLYQMLFEGSLPGEMSREEAWHSYDVERDELLKSAEVMAAASLDIWLMRTLSILRQMLANDPAQRIDAEGAYKAMRQVASLPMRPRNSQRVLRVAKRRVLNREPAVFALAFN